MADDKNEIQVLVVDDSAFMRKIIQDILNGDGEVKVISTARNGKEALEKVKTLKPDVITLDVEMPEIDGLSCLKEINKITNTPVIMLSGLTREGADLTIRALEAGAIDFIAKPVNLFSLAGEEKKKELTDKIKMAYRSVNKAKPITKKIPVNEIKPQGIIKPIDIEKKPVKPRTSTYTGTLNIVAIGTSTGGPRALQSVLPFIPEEIPAAILIVQHMPPNFTKSLAERLNDMSKINVKEAEDGDVLVAGTAYIAPGDYHMRVNKLRNGTYVIKLDKEPAVGGHRPSVNVMMTSLSETGIRGNVIGVIMTGMGADGSEGLKMLKNNNKAFTIAQDEKSCVVYGMPKSAYLTGAVDVVVPLNDISNEILKHMEVRKNGFEPIS
jgi:Chemotaxis response regulator containing a CheY-like receiver domain and a methylesterase domain